MLAAGDVAVHRVVLDIGEAERRRLESLLSADEQQRANRFRFAADRERFVVTRGQLRTILASYGAGSPAALRFVCGKWGKLGLPSRPEIGFNVSHSGGVALVAVTHLRDVGIDVEQFAPGRLSIAVACRFFSPPEVVALTRLRGRTLEVALLRCWCRKEAYVKARGLGLHLALDSFEVEVDPEVYFTCSRLRATHPDPNDASIWDVRDLEMPDGYVAALAIQGPMGRVIRVG